MGRPISRKKDANFTKFSALRRFNPVENFIGGRLLLVEVALSSSWWLCTQRQPQPERQIRQVGGWTMHYCLNLHTNYNHTETYLRFKNLILQHKFIESDKWGKIEILNWNRSRARSFNFLINSKLNTWALNIDTGVHVFDSNFWSCTLRLLYLAFWTAI